MEHAARWEQSDATLVARCKSDDWAAFDEILQRYQHRVYGYVKRLVGNETDAEDITQEVFWKAFCSLKQFREQSSLQTWLFRIATNLCRDWHRRHQRERDWVKEPSQEQGQIALEMSNLCCDPQQVVLNQELHTLLHQAILALPVGLREVLVLRDIEALSYEQIAQVLNIPLGTVKSRLFYARMQLRALLSDYVSGEDT